MKMRQEKDEPYLELLAMIETKKMNVLDFSWSTSTKFFIYFCLYILYK
jgi:hypothetical protein